MGALLFGFDGLIMSTARALGYRGKRRSSFMLT